MAANWWGRVKAAAGGKGTFVVGLALGATGFTLTLLQALLQLKIHGDPVYLCIWAFGIALLGLGLYPLYKMQKRIAATAKKHQQG